MKQITPLPRKTVFLVSAVLYGFLIFITLVASRLQGFEVLSYSAALFFLASWLSVILRLLKTNSSTLFLFITLQPFFILIYFSFLTIHVQVGRVDWLFALLTVILYTALWLIPVFFPKFTEAYTKEYSRPRKLWARILFRYLLLPLFMIAPAGVRGLLVLDRVIDQTSGSLALRVYAAFAMLLIAFSLQLSFIAQTWPYIVNPNYSPPPKTKASRGKLRDGYPFLATNTRRFHRLYDRSLPVPFAQAESQE